MHIWTSIVDPYSFENTYPVGSGPFIFYNQISEVVWGLTTADFAGYQMVSLDWPEDAIVWTEEAGDYLIGVDYYTGELPLDYTITISYDGYTKTISEIFSSEDILSIDNVPSSASEIEGIHYVTLPANTEVTINVDWITQGGYADLDIYMWSPSSEYTPDLDSLVLQRWHDYYNTPHEPKLLDSYVSITPSWASTIDFSVYWRVNGPYEVTDATVYWAYSSDNIAWTSWDLLGEFAPLSTYGAGYIDLTSIYGEGHYAFRIEATDVIGHTSSFEFYSGVDLVAPVAEAGQDWIIQQWDYLIFDGSDSTDNIEIASYQWTFTDGEPVTLWGVSPSYQFTSDGTFEVTLTVTDNAGHQSVDYMTVYVVYDTAPPETTVTGPPSGSTVGDDVTYNIESQDETGVATTEVYLDGELVLAEDSAVVDYILDPTTVADGQHTLEIVVTDVFGQEQVTVYVVFTDTTAPEVQSYVPPECSGGCDFTVDARDETGIDRVEFWLDGELRVIDYTDPYVFYIYTPDLTDGEHTLEIIVYDLVGNFVADVQIFVVDNSAPVLTDFTQSWHNGIPGWDLTISATLTDFGTITSCNAIIRSTDGFQVVVPMVNTGLDIFEVTWTVPDTIIGDFFVDIQAVDNLGNIGHYADTGTFTVHDYISVCAIYSEPQLFDYLGQTINRTWNDFFDADGHPLAYFLDDGVSVEILYLSPTQGLYDVEVTYLSGSEYSLEIVATSAGAIIYEELYESLPFGMGAIHEFVVSYSDDPSNSWSDSFDDEDLSDWSITWGDFTAAGGIMTGVTSIWNWANIGSTMTCGTWRFDVHYMGTASFNVWFMTNELVGSEGEPREGYFIHISMYTNSIQLMRDLNRGQIVLDSYTPEGGLDGWWEISVTRYANGEMFVYIDGVLRLHAVDTSFDSSQWFAFETFNTHSIDNIVLTEFAGAGAVADSEALPEGLVVTATDVLYILPGDYLLCQLNWFNIDPGVARDVEIVLEFSEYLEFVSCSYPIVVDGNTITFDIGSVEGFSLEYIEVTFYMVNLLANDGDQLWLNSTMSYSDDWFLFDFESQDNQLVTVVTVTPENSVQTSWWWKNEFTFVLAGQASTYDLNHLQTLVTVIAYSSELYSDITTVEQALLVLTLNDYKGPRGLALRELYGVWLNLANDALNADTVIDLGNLTTAGTVGEAIIECEAVLMVGSSSVRDLLNVMRICQEINAGR
ncbi:MAG: PKD domain-containing protein, partial [Candidatus Thorarchaeota archaeon]